MVTTVGRPAKHCGGNATVVVNSPMVNDMHTNGDHINDTNDQM
jgi:hypothetical protein